MADFVRRAHKLFEKQPASEKRRLLNFVLSNCTWEHGKLCVNLREPFDLPAKTSEKARSADLPNTTK
jgi:site-specific DNA recombinase